MENATAPPASRTLAVQPRESFTCPTWCDVDHRSVGLDSWDHGQWLARHEGKWRRWETSRGTEVKARLTWTEIVGSSRVVVESHLDLVGPYIELEGDDGSCWGGVNEIVAADWLAWQRHLSVLVEEVSA